MSKSFSLRDRAKKVDYTYKVSEEPLYREDDSPHTSPKKSKPKKSSSADKKSPKRKSSAITAENSPSYEDSDEEDKPVRKIMKKVDNPVYVFNGKSLSEFSLTTDNDQPSTQPSTSSLKEKPQISAISRPSSAAAKSKASSSKKDTVKAATKAVVDKAEKSIPISTSAPAKSAAKTSKASASSSIIPESDIEMKAFARTLLAQHPGFRMFATEERRDIVASLPNPSTEAVMRECCHRWLALTDKQRRDMDEDSGHLDTPMSWKSKDTATIAAAMAATNIRTSTGTGMGIARDMSDADATIDDLDAGSAALVTTASRAAGTGTSTTSTGTRTTGMGVSVPATGGRARPTSTGKGATSMGADEMKDSRARGASVGKDRANVEMAREEKSDREIVTSVVPENTTNASAMAKKTTVSASRVAKPAVAPGPGPAENWDVHNTMNDFDNSETAEDWGFTTRKTSKSSEKSKPGIATASTTTSATSRTRTTTDAPRMGVRPAPREPLSRENAAASTVARTNEPMPVNILHARPRPISPVRTQPVSATGTARGRDTSPSTSHHGTRAHAQVQEGRAASTSPARAQVPIPTNTQSSRAAVTSAAHPDVRDPTRAPLPVPASMSAYHAGGVDEVLQLYDQQGRPITYIRAPPVSPRRNMHTGYFPDVPGYPGVPPRPFPELPLRVAPPSPSYPRPVGSYAHAENAEYMHARQHGGGIGASYPSSGPGVSSSGNIVDTPRTIRMNELLTHADSELVSLHRKSAIPSDPSSPVRKTPALGNAEGDFSDMVPDHEALNYYYNSYVRLHTQYDTLKQKYMGVQSNFEDMKAELQKVRSDFEKLDRTRVMLQQERDSAVREATSIKHEMSQLREDLEHQRVTAETALKTPAKERETLQQRILASDAARDELRKKLGELERLLLREKEDKEKVISRGQEEREAMRVRMLQLEAQIETQKREMSEELFSERRRCSEAEIRIRETENYYTDRLREMDDSYNTLYDAHNAFEQDVARALIAYRTLCGVDMIQNAQKENLYRCEARGTRFQREIIFDLEFLDDNSEVRYIPRDIRVMDIPVPNFLHDTINFDSKQAPLFLKNLTTVLTDVPKPPLMPQTHMGMAPNMGVHMGTGGMSGGPVQASVMGMGVSNGMTPHPTGMSMMAPVSASQMHMNNNPYGIMPGQPMTDQQQRQAYLATMQTQQAAQAQRQNEQPPAQKPSSKGRKK